MALASVITSGAAAQLLVAAQWYDEREPASPYAIYYEQEAERIVVLTFLAMSQEQEPERRR